MLKHYVPTAFLLRGLCCVVLLAFGWAVRPAIWGQEPPSPSDDPPVAAETQDPAEAEPPAQAEPDATEPDAIPEPPAPTVVARPLLPVDTTRLGHPAVADQLELTDEQRAAVARLINERAEALAAAEPAQREAVLADSDQKLMALLNEGQRAKLAAMTETQKLRFNFRFQRWDEVLDWFARQAGLALVMDQPPSGAFTYSDNRAYTPTEAIDLLNSVLLTKGYSLIQRGRMLILVNLSDDLPLNLIPRVSPEEIGQHGRFEIISALFPLGRRPADMVAKEVQPLLGRYGSCVALPQTRQLLVTETAGKLQAIGILIASIPEPPLPKEPPKPPERPAPPPPQLAVYPVTVIDPAAAVETLSILVPNAKFKIDDKVDQIMAYATPNEQAAIKGAIEQMEANRPPENEPRLAIYPIDLPDTEQLLEQLKAILPKAMVSLDEAQGRLLVFAEPKDQDQIKTMIQQLGAVDDGGARQVVVYQPKRFDATTLATLVKELLPRADVSSDPKLRRVVVSTSPGNQEMVKSLVEQLDQESALEDQPLLQVYALDHPLDATILTTLTAMLPETQLTLSTDRRQITAVARVVDQTVVKRLVDQWQQIAQVRGEPALQIHPLQHSLAASDVATVQSLVPEAQVTASADGRQLRVVARAEDQEKVAALLEQLEQAATAESKPQMVVYPLRKPLSASVLATFTTLVPAAQVTLSSDAKQLIVVARAEDQEVVKKTLDQIAASTVLAADLQLEFYQVDGIAAAQLQTLLQPLVTESTISVDATQDRLIVWGPAEEHAAFEDVVAKLAQDPLAGTKPVLEYYPLPDESLSTGITTVLTTLAPAARVTWDAPSERLMVIATPKDQLLVRTTIEQMLKDAVPVEKPVLRLYALSSAQRARFTVVQADLLQRFPGMRVIEDPETGELAIWARARQHEDLAAVLDELKVADDSADRPFVVAYRVRRGSGKSVFEMLQKIYPTARIFLDEKADVVTADAPLSVHARIKQTLAQLDIEPRADSEEALRSYTVGDTNPTVLVPMLQSLVSDMQLQADLPTKRIIAWGTVADHEILEKAIEQFRSGEPGQRPVVRTYSVEGRDTTTLYQMRSVLLQLVPEAVIAIDPRGGSIVVSAREADQQAIGASINQLIEMDQAANQRLETYTLRRLKATQMITALQPLAPTARIVAGAMPDQIIVWAGDEDHQRIKAALEKLEESAGSQSNRTLKGHPIKKVAATQVTAVIAATLPDLQILAGQGTDQLLVFATPEDHQRLSELIQQVETELQLDVDRAVLVFDLENVTAAQAQQILDAAVGGLEYVPTTVPGRLVVWADPAKQPDIEKVLAELKKVVALPDEVIRVHQYDPDELAVSTIYAALSPADLSELTIQVNAATNSLIVRGPARRQEELAKTLDQLYAQLPAVEKPEMQIYRLKRADVSSAALLVRTLVPTAQVVPDTAGRSLAITATFKQHADIKMIVDQLDGDEQGERVTETYVLKRANPAAIVPAITPIVPGAILSPDVTNKTLIVSATADDHQKIKAIIEQADLRGEGELTTKAYVLEWANPYTIMTALTPIVPQATISPDITNKTLIVTASAPDHARIDSVLQQADRRGDGTLTTKAYPLKWANPYTITTALTPVVPDAKVSADPLNKMLIVTASEKDHKRIQEVLDQADLRGGGDMITTTYRLQSANPYTITTALTTVVPNAKISPDPTNRLLIATATAEDHLIIKEIIDQADSREDGERTTQVYALQWANPATLSVAITPIAPTATISPDVVNKTLIVTATAKDHERIQSVVDQADKRGGGDLITKAYPLKWATPYTISTALTSVVPNATISSDIYNKMLIATASKEDHERIQAVLDQADTRGGGDPITTAYRLQTANPSTILAALLTVVPDAKISSDPTNRMLIATASAEDHLRIKAIIDEADGTEEGERTTEVYALQWANPSTLSASITPIAPTATISPDVVNKTLIVTATAKDHARIKSVVDQADKRGGGDLITKAYPLKWATPYTISTALTAAVPNATISSDIYNKMVIATATKEDHERIQAVLDQADTRGGGDPVTTAYRLQTANPSTILAALLTVVPDAKISSDPTNRMLIATASAEDQLRIKAIIDEADGTEDGERTTEVYALQWANPTTLSASITPIAPTATVSPDVVNKTLIVTATAKDHERIKSVVDQADKRGGGDLITKAYPLKWATPYTISTALTAAVPNATISSDIYNKMVIATATKEDHERIQAVLDQADTRGGGDPVTTAYRLQTANPSTILAALLTVVPDAKISSDPTNRMLIATASAEDQLRIKAIIDEADGTAEGERTTVVYPLKWANPSALSLSIQPIAPTATVSPDVTNKTLIVTAAEKDHLRIKSVVEQADRRGSGDLTTVAYTLRLANPSTIMAALTPVIPDATISADAANKVLIVTAPASDQERVKMIVEQADRRGEGDLSTKVYAFKLASPATIATALRALLPNAVIGSDPGTNTLIVTTTQEDHLLIDPLVQQLDVVDPKSPVVKPYSVRNAKARDIYDSLSQLYRFNRDVSVGFQEETGMLLVLAPESEQQLVAQAINDIDKAIEGRPQAMLQVYPLEGLDGNAVVESLERLFAKETPKLEVQIDSSNNQMLVIAEPAQHLKVRDALEQLTPEPRDVEVFTLQRVDPYTARSAINTMFLDVPFAATPSVEADPDTQQLIVQATPSQMRRIEQLLEKMGEGARGVGPAAPSGASGTLLRVLPMGMESDALLRQIEQIWPQVRGNKIEVVTPPRTNSIRANPRGESGRKPADSSALPPGQTRESPQAAADVQAPVMLVSAPAPAPAQDTVPTPANDPLDPSRPAEPSPAPQAGIPSREPAIGQELPPVGLPDSEVEPAQDAPPLPPIVVIAEPGRLTIASRDREALDQFESLWKALQRGKRVAIATGNFSMFLLQNADAKELAEVFNELFRRGQRGGQGETSRFAFRRSTNLTVVADERMNALLVYGSLADRQTVEEMLDVLDSVDISNSLSAERPRMIPVKNLPATKVLVVLESVYRTQLTARRGLRPLSVPQGVSPQVTAMLELLNATANAPILTLNADQTTNSIVMRAPRQLAEEIEEFVYELDESAQDGGTRSISLVPLKDMNTREVQDALQMLMGGGRYRGRRQ